jgi:hypothetical protein
MDFSPWYWQRVDKNVELIVPNSMAWDPWMHGVAELIFIHLAQEKLWSFVAPFLFACR